MGRWSEENPNPHAIYPRIYTASSPHTTYNRAFNDYHVFDADYFRFKTMTIGYNIPRNIVSRLGMSSLKVYLTGENLFTIRADHKMKDFDPEATSKIRFISFCCTSFINGSTSVVYCSIFVFNTSGVSLT